MKLSKFRQMLAVGALALGSASAANATIFTVFDGVAAGRASFDATVTGAGGTVANTVLSGLVGGVASVDAGDFSISNNDGANVSFQNYGSLSGQVVRIDPVTTGSDNGTGTRDAPSAYFNSGVTFTFDSPVNSVGFEVGDWATCCHSPVTELFISFDGGAPITVATADDSGDGLFPSQNNPAFDVFEIFVAAFDDTGTFSTVSFWGNGIGEVLAAGGDVRYSAIPDNSLPGVPVPAAGWLMIAGLGGLGALRRRRKAA